MNESVKELIQKILMEIYQNGIRWKSGKDIYHLNKRKSRSHIPQNWQLIDYNKHIMNILKEKDSEIYIYFKQTFLQNYYVFADGEQWIVIIGEDGVMETAMIADNYPNYLSAAKGYQYLGKIKEVFTK